MIFDKEDLETESLTVSLVTTALIFSDPSSRESNINLTSLFKAAVSNRSLGRYSSLADSDHGV
jgi:hypothetical protein